MNKINVTAPFRADIVGSFLRPAVLKNARVEFSGGKISSEKLKQVENECITNLIKKQITSGLNVITDGEYRRSYWHLDFMWGFTGIKKIELNHGYYFHGEETTHGSIEVIGKISGENHPFVEHFKFVKQFEQENIVARQTMPAPAQLLAELYREDNTNVTTRVYPDKEELISDIAQAYRTVIKDLYNAGCRNIQFDDCTWGMFCDTTYWANRQKNNVSLEKEAAEYLRINNLAIQGKPEDLILNTHVCRGNYHSTYACSGGYDPIAPFLFAKEKVNAFYLEFDDDRSGGFEPLKFVTQEKKVVLGLITTKSPKLENKETIIARIHEAEKYIPLNRLCLSPQCGFASCEIGNKLTEEEQWKKIALIQEIAKEVWEG